MVRIQAPTARAWGASASTIVSPPRIPQEPRTTRPPPTPEPASSPITAIAPTARSPPPIAPEMILARSISSTRRTGYVSEDAARCRASGRAPPTAPTR